MALGQDSVRRTEPGVSRWEDMPRTNSMSNAMNGLGKPEARAFLHQCSQCVNPGLTPGVSEPGRGDADPPRIPDVRPHHLAHVETDRVRGCVGCRRCAKGSGKRWPRCRRRGTTRSSPGRPRSSGGEFSARHTDQRFRSPGQISCGSARQSSRSRGGSMGPRLLCSDTSSQGPAAGDRVRGSTVRTSPRLDSATARESPDSLTPGASPGITAERPSPG